MEQFSHPERIETCFLVVIECYKWFKMIFKYSYLIPIVYFLVKYPTSPSFSGLLQGNAFRSSNPNPQLVYLSLVDVPGPQTAPIFLPVDLNIHKRWVVFLNLWNHMFFLVAMVLLCFIAVSLFSRAKEFEEIKQHAWNFIFLNKQFSLWKIRWWGEIIILSQVGMEINSNKTDSKHSKKRRRWREHWRTCAGILIETQNMV